MMTALMVSPVTPGVVAPPLSPTNLGMHGGDDRLMLSWSCAPGAHRERSPVSGRPRESTDCAACVDAAAASLVPAAAPLVWTFADAMVPDAAAPAPPPAPALAPLAPGGGPPVDWSVGERAAVPCWPA